VCRAFLEQIPKNCDVAYIFNPKLTVPELLQTVCEEFHVKLPPQPAGGAPLTVKDHVDAINRFLLASHAKGRSAVLIIDEAQSLAPDVLEQLRLLTNLETHERKLLQIILIGQPELRDMLASPGLEQLAQRVIARCHLSSLTAGETVRYVQHRLAVAGGKGGASVPFDPEAMARLFQLTGGVPRRINLLAGRAMLGAYAHGRSVVDRTTVEKAAGEVFDVRRGGGARAAARASGMRPRSSSSGRESRPAGFSASAPLAGDGEGAHRRGWAAWALVLGAGLVLGLGTSTWVWRDAIFGAGAGARGAAGTAGPASAARAADAASGAGTTVHAAGPRAGASAAGGVAEPPAAERFDEPAALLAAAWVDEAAAWRALAMAWQSPLGAGDVCARAAPAAGLACFRTRGGLAAVRQLDRPGLVWLRTRDDAPPVVALLVALDERGITLQTQGRHFRLSAPALAGVWRGEFATLWRTPPGWREPLAAASAPALPASTRAWVQERLAEAGVGDAGRPMRERLWSYQVARGLPPDGRPTPTTLMQLARGAQGASASQATPAAGVSGEPVLPAHREGPAAALPVAPLQPPPGPPAAPPPPTAAAPQPTAATTPPPTAAAAAATRAQPAAAASVPAAPGR
ncbi:MAG: AAA family ATPase, partial [Rubrivivax sp.]|nr:AAA family ATPase [Rubrivivax sp.]